MCLPQKSYITVPSKWKFVFMKGPFPSCLIKAEGA